MDNIIVSVAELLAPIGIDVAKKHINQKIDENKLRKLEMSINVQSG